MVVITVFSATAPERFDVIVVGARCAGSPLAMLLARAGLRVCLLDRARFPSETPSTHGIQPTGVEVLGKLGVRDRVADVAAAIDRASMAFNEVRFEVDGITRLVGAPMLNVRRVTLDTILVDAAAAAGADVRTATAVTGLVVEDGRVAGVRTRSGELRAPLVVGADGVRSTVARLVGAREYDRIPCGRVFVWAYYEHATADPDRLWIGQVGDHGFLASRTDGGLFMAAVVPSAHRRTEILHDRAAAMSAGLAEWPELAACVADAQRVGPVRVMSGMAGYLRESAGPGWALVGDAGHFKDPSPGQGIADALRQAVALAPVIERGLGGAANLDRALRAWWEWRDRDAWEMYRFAAELGAPGPAPPLMHEVERRIARDQELTERLLRVLNHELRPSEVFRPPLALRALASGLRRGEASRVGLLREAAEALAVQMRNRRPPPLPPPRAVAEALTSASAPPAPPGVRQRAGA